jgi:hypothetical protein
MECGKSLALPKDIPWKRLAYSIDMTDPVMDSNLPSKWRSSLGVFYHEVPEEETIEDYPDRRIVFLKVTASITGFNLNEAAVCEDIKRSILSGNIAEAECSRWEALFASQWVRKYFPCYGAILQVCVFPHKDDLEEGDTWKDEFGYLCFNPEDPSALLKKIPYIMDFEPKKREVFEARTESGEFLAGSSSTLNTGKSHTNTKSLSVSAEVSVGAGPASASVGMGYEKTTQDVTYTNKEWAREKRESFSHSTSLNQIYSIFDGYHLGTNRAMFVIQPRPHIVSTDFNLIDGIRKLEGIQDVFLVVSIPKDNKGFCVQAHLDTGHIAEYEKYIPIVKTESEMNANPEYYEKTAKMLYLPESERDLHLENTIRFLNDYYNFAEDDPVDYRSSVVGGNCYIDVDGMEIMKFARSEDPSCENKAVNVLGKRFYGGEDAFSEKLYVIYEKGTKRYEDRMLMTRRTVQNCALFDRETGLLNPAIPSSELPPMQAAGPSFTFETSTALVSAPNTDDMRDPAKKSSLVHSYNQLSNQIMKNMLNAYSGSTFKPKGVSLTETEMFKKSMKRKLANMPDYHPANIELSKLKNIDKKTREELERAGIKTIKDVFVPKPIRRVKEEKVPYGLILDLQSEILSVKTPENSKDDMKQQSAQKKQPTNKKEESKK